MAFWKRKLRRRHIKLAESERFLLSARRVPTNTNAALAEARRLMRRLGIRERTKLPTRTKWARMGTMLPWCALWPSDWGRMTNLEKAAMRWHELCHALQWRAGWFGRYAIAEWRWALEVNGYRMQIRAMRRMGVRSDYLLNVVENVAKRLRKTYRLRFLDSRQVRSETRRILRAEALA